MDIEKLSRQAEGIVEPVGEKANAAVQKNKRYAMYAAIAIAALGVGLVLIRGF